LTAALNRVAVLLGEAPGDLHTELERDEPIPTVPAEVAVGLPAELLRQRPDVRRAERDLAAQTARIGVAVADLYPRFSLTGFLGLRTASSGEFFNSDSVNWGVGLPFIGNIFAGGRVRANIDVEKARTEQQLAFYEQTVLLALEEVENVVVSFARERERRGQLLRAVDATQRSVDLVRTQYMAGLSDFQNVLDTQRSLVDQQDQLAASRGDVVKNLISLYKALGGGWALDESRPETLTSGALPPAPVPVVE
jgi:NodT family efflux transporter outer membrane factor (OMF) lipoprotein